MRLLRIGLVAGVLCSSACGDDDDPRRDGGASVHDGGTKRDAGDAASEFDAGQPVALPDECLSPLQLQPANGPQLPFVPPGGAACVDVGEPFSARCDGAFCLDAPRTPFDAPVAIGGSSLRDVWLLAEDGALAHLGCNGWTRLPERLAEFPRCTTPARFADCSEARREDEDDEPNVGTCGATCRFAARAPDDVWLSNSEGPLHHFDGASWSRVDAPEDLVGASVWITTDRQVWLTGGADQPARVYRRDGDAWVAQSAGAVAELDVPVLALAGDAIDHVWASSGESSKLLRFDGAGWSWIETGSAGTDSLIVLGRDAVWLGGDPVQRWNGSAIETFNARGQLAAGGSGEVWAFPAQGAPQRWSGGRFRAQPHPRADSDFVQAGFGGRAWLTDRAGGVSMFEDGSWRFVLDGDALSTVDVRAVHGSERGSTWAIGERGEILRRDPNGWKQLHTLELAPAPFRVDPCCSPDTAQGLFARADDDVWFFGERNVTKSVLSHWDGQCFREHNLDDAYVAAFYSAAPDAAWAVGERVYAWDGERWSDQKLLEDLTPDYAALAVWGTGPDDVWVGGGERLNIDLGEGREDPLPLGWIVRWDGATWSPLELPRDTSMVDTIAGTGPNDVWILTALNLLHWDGTEFSDRTPERDPMQPRFWTATLHAPASGSAILCFDDEEPRVWSGTDWQPDPDLTLCPTWAPSHDEAWSVERGQAWRFTR